MSVIQGSILGPILFLVYIDDLPSSSSLETFLFADDTQGLKAGHNLPKLIVFDNNDPHAPFDPNLVSALERVHSNHIDPSSRSYKLLGVLFDEHLSFNFHIDLIKSKLSKALFCINRIKNFVPQKTLKTLYFSLFHSHLLYCPIIASCTTKTNLEKIFLSCKKKPYVV